MATHIHVHDARTRTGDPLSKKGKKILAAMKEQYGSEKKAKEVFYASRNKGTISGVDKKAASATRRPGPFDGFLRG